MTTLVQEAGSSGCDKDECMRAAIDTAFITYSSDAPQQLDGDKSAALFEQLRAELPTVTGSNTVHACGVGTAWGLQRIYVHRRPTTTCSR